MFATYPNEDYDRRNEDVDPMAASAEYELEKRVERLDLFPVELEKGIGHYEGSLSLLNARNTLKVFVQIELVQSCWIVMNRGYNKAFILTCLGPWVTAMRLSISKSQGCLLENSTLLSSGCISGSCLQMRVKWSLTGGLLQHQQ